jgi:hypothetical protein
MIEMARRVVGPVALGLALAVVAAACGDDGDGGGAATTAIAPVATTEAPPLEGGGFDPSLTRDDVDCSEEGLGEGAEFDFTTAHFVVDGDLGAVCLGEEDPTLVQAWSILSEITPGGQLADLALFAGFGGGDDGEEVTLAFVNVLDDDSQFQMSVNLAAADEDPDEFTLTMVHEFGHVFTALPTELDRFVTPEECTTYDNGEGCYIEGSLMADWVTTFWGGGLAEEVDPTVEATTAEGQDRCDVDPGFFGAYAASNPEEDFAEAFSAFVLQVPAETPEQDERYLFFEARPGLVEFRDRAVAAGYGPQAHNFDPCGEAA